MQFRDPETSESLCKIITEHKTILKGDYTVLTEHENIMEHHGKPGMDVRECKKCDLQPLEKSKVIIS